MSTANSKKSKAGAKASGPTASPTKGYKGHKPGSRKETIHQLYDREGADTAWTRGLRMKLAEGTLRSWFGQWQRSGPKPKVAAKTPPKAKGDKAKVNGNQQPPRALATPEATIAAPEPAILTA